MASERGVLELCMSTLGVGIAVMEISSWRVVLQNDCFVEWFPERSSPTFPPERFPGFREDRARKSLERGRPYLFESEIKSQSRSIGLRTRVTRVDTPDGPYALFESIDISKEKKQEHMLDSFATLADRKSQELEAANNALQQRTRELEEAYGVIKRQKDRMQHELEVARQVQRSLLPSDLTPHRRECTIVARLEPAREVGGDFFDFFFLDDDRLCIAVGDVSDKGAAAGLFMAAAKTLLKSSSTPEASTAAIVGTVNRELARNNESCMFVTLLFLVVHLGSGEVLFTNCGHNPPYLMRPDEPAARVGGRHGPLLGIRESAEYSVGSFQLKPGDRLFAYTDGVTEALSRSNELFGVQRLEQVLNGHHPSANDVLKATTEAIQRFEDGGPQSDDVTVLVMEFHGRHGRGTKIAP